MSNDAYDRIPNLYKLLTTCGIFYNIWLIYRAGYFAQNRSFYVAMLLGGSTVLYGALELMMKTLANPNIEFPVVVSTVLFFSFLGLMGYSVARHQAFLEQRVGPRDFLSSSVMITLIAAVYLIPGSQIGLSPERFILLASIVIASHAGVDLLRETLNHIFHEGERESRRAILHLQTNSGEENLRANLRRGLAIVCLHLQATRGFIAIRNADKFIIQASLHSYPVKTELPSFILELNEVSDNTGTLSETAWLAPAFDGQTLVAVIGIGPRRGLKDYLEGDLFWLEDVADAIGKLVGGSLRNTGQITTRITPNPNDQHTPPKDQPSSAANYLPKFALNPDKEAIRQVEFGLRNLHDFIILGRSPLADQVEIDGETHIERGQTLHHTLVNLIKTLRPAGDRPKEPLPRAWHSYVILHDAYVEDVPDQEIMARLYISETTYYRTRRRAVRGVTRALLESGIVR